MMLSLCGLGSWSLVELGLCALRSQLPGFGAHFVFNAAPNSQGCAPNRKAITSQQRGFCALALVRAHRAGWEDTAHPA